MPKYDDVGWHDRSGEFVHVGLYLAWLVVHDLVSSEMVDPATSAAMVRSRAISLLDFAAVFDGKLVSWMLRPEGDDFTAQFYEQEFLPMWAAYKDSEEPASLGDGWEAYASIAPSIDTHFAAWKNAPRSSAAQRRRASKPAPGRPESEARAIPVGSTVAMDAFARSLGVDIHAAVDLEERLRVVPGAKAINSISGVKDPRLRSVLRRLAVGEASATSAYALAKTTDGLVVLTAVRVSGLDSDTLAFALRDTVYTGRGASWGSDTIEGRTIHLAKGRKSATAVWVGEDGVAFHVAGPPAAVRSAVDLLMGSGRRDGAE
jgi:hypothetical protein